MSEHTISVKLENKAGALVRVSQLFARRGYNIQSLAVGPTERDDISRLTLRVDCSEHSLEQIEKQMHKLVNVLRVTELRPEEAARARARTRHVASRPGAAPTSSRPRWRPARRSRISVTTRSRSRSSADRMNVDAFEQVVHPLRVRELARTGRIGLRRPRPTNNGNHSPPTERTPMAEIDQGRKRRSALRKGRRARLRQPGPRARAQPLRLRRRGRGRPPFGQPLARRRRGSGADRGDAGRGGPRRAARRAARARRRAARALPRRGRAEPGARRCAPLRARLQRPLRAHRAARRATT